MLLRFVYGVIGTIVLLVIIAIILLAGCAVGAYFDNMYYGMLTSVLLVGGFLGAFTPD